MPWPRGGRGRGRHKGKRYITGRGGNSLPAYRPNVYRRRTYHTTSHLQHVGNVAHIDAYPVKHQNCEKRLSDVFGKPYQNTLWKEDKQNEWNHKSILHNEIEWSNIEKPVARGIAINQATGWVVIMSMTKIWVFEPKESCKYTVNATYSFTQFEELKDEDKSMSRIRFVGNQLFVFSHSRTSVFIYKLSNNKITLKASLQDNYFRDSRTVDIAATDDLLFILFDRWCGVYKLHPTLEWYHAIAFSKEAAHFTRSLEINVFAETTNDTVMSFIQFDESHTIPDPLGFTKLDEFYRKSNKNYMIINTEHSLIGVHPSNPSFDFLYIADSIHSETSYCSSKHYGIFYTSNNDRVLMQSPHLMHKSCTQIIDLNIESKVSLKWKFYPIGSYHDSLYFVDKFYNIIYDENYGISGRLLLFCQTKDRQYSVHQMINYDELVHFSNINDGSTDFYSVPGILIVYVYQMLFGNELIQQLLCSINTEKHGESFNIPQSFQYLQQNMRSLMKTQKDNYRTMKTETNNIHNELYSISLKISHIEAQISTNRRTVTSKLDECDNKMNTIQSDSSAIHEELLTLKQDIENIKHQLFTNNGLSTEKMRLKHWMKNDVKLEYFDVFILHGIDDLEIVTELTLDILQSIGIDKVGHRLKIMKCVKKLKENHYHYNDIGGCHRYKKRRNSYQRQHSPPMQASSSEKSIQNAQNYDDSDW